MPNKNLIVFGSPNLPWIRPLIKAFNAKKINTTCIEIIVTKNMLRWGGVKTLKKNELLWYLPPGFNGCFNYIFKRIIQHRLRRLFAVNTYCVVFDPSLVKNIPKDVSFVYYMYDDNSLKEIEDQVACTDASVIVCTSRLLYSRTKNSYPDKKILYSSHATNGITRTYLQKKENIISSIGAITDQYDWPLIASVVFRLPHTKFYFIGELHLAKNENKLIWKNLLLRQNFHYEDNTDELYRYSVYNRSRIIWFPYDLQQDFNKYRSPLRFFNAVEAQCLIVSAEIPEVREYRDFVRIYSSLEDVMIIFQALASNCNKLVKLKEYNTFISENTWNSRATSLARAFFE